VRDLAEVVNICVLSGFVDARGFLLCGSERGLQDLAQVTGTPPGRVVRRGPEGDRLRGHGTCYEVLLNEELVLARVYLDENPGARISQNGNH